MLTRLLKYYIFPAAVLSGGIIGVGFLALPYITMKVGILVMSVYFFGIAFLVLILHLIFAKISLETPDFKRFPGFVGYYFGKWGEGVALLTSAIGYCGILLAYLIVGGEFLTEALSPIIGGSNLSYTFIYFLFAIIIIFLGIRIISRIELASIVLLLVAIIFIAIKGFEYVEISNIFQSASISNISDYFLPYGAILFSLLGFGLIPEVEEMLRGGHKKIFNRVIIIGSLVPVIIYSLFIILILGITGSQTTESALVGLRGFLGSGVMTIVILMGAMVTFVSFVVHGMTFKKILMYDLKIKKWHAVIITCVTPLILFLLGLKSIIILLSFIGGVVFGINGLFIVFMYKQIGGKNIIVYPLSLIFIIGIIYGIFSFIK